ncbi:MAG: insulinase family protein [Chloroflexaceae bacterium]|nr:insulinase family protein [Chloroflexaceae bacterium]
MVETIVVPGGPVVLLDTMPHIRSVAMQCLIGVGACAEQQEQSGISHLIEHMCFKGTRSWPDPRLLSMAIEGVGGVMDASTMYESTVYWVKVADIHTDLALRILLEMVSQPLFVNQELEKERRVIVEEIRGIQDSPSDYTDVLIQSALWGDQPLGRDIAGSIESVNQIGHAAMRSFWQAHYQPSNMILSIAGHITPQQRQSIEHVLATLPTNTNGSATRQDPTRPGSPMLPVSPPRPGPDVVIATRMIEQGSFCIGFPAPSYHDPDRFAFRVLDTVLGGGMSSRLFQEMREERGLSYNVGSYHSLFASTGMWAIYGGVSADDMHESIAVICSLLRELVAHGITEEELALVQSQVRGSLLLSLENTLTVASRQGELYLHYGYVVPPEETIAAIEAVTTADVHRLAQQLLRREMMQIAVVGPYPDSDSLRSSLLEAITL